MLSTALATGVVDVGAILEVTKTLLTVVKELGVGRNEAEGWVKVGPQVLSQSIGVVTETLVAKVVGTELIGKELGVGRNEAGGWVKVEPQVLSQSTEVVAVGVTVKVTETLAAVGKELGVERKEAGGWVQPVGGHMDERAAPREKLAKAARKRRVVMSLCMVAIVVGIFRGSFFQRSGRLRPTLVCSS